MTTTPDDAWDASDNVIEQLRNIGGRAQWLVDHRDDIAARIQRLVGDIEFIRERVRNGDV